ncbi:MAG: 6,7-dimethyl-8-ribityllumazine synthase [Deltaproteobacteria bacterium]|nr:MAG: 6,7-dimethyl-8-ribityllumazine synthase [Deltaproteobacteria bacterium]
MPRYIEGAFHGKGLSVAVVVGRFNNFVSERLLEGALDALSRHGVEDGDITVYRVPGSFELPAMVNRLAASGRFDAIVVLGCLIRGGTAHFDLIAAEVFKGVAATSMEYPVAIGMGVITADTLEQAIERGGSKMGNKGFDAAMSALEMANLYKAAATAKHKGKR